jgi:GTP pyrophosphokinase
LDARSRTLQRWIGNPRDNLYQSLHTSVIGDTGQSFEVQIRTEEMHHVAEEGVAAHWKYKEKKLGKNEEDASLDELRKTVEKLLLPLVESTNDTEDSEDFIESLKLDLYPKDVYAFTPMGKIIQLPRGATPLDFAYAIHSEVGDACTGAKIKGRIVPLKTELQNGDVVEILTTPNSKPSRDWLNYVVTSKRETVFDIGLPTSSVSNQSKSDANCSKRKPRNFVFRRKSCLTMKMK